MRVLVIAPHPDDETLGCGGSLLDHRERKDELFWLIATRCEEPRWSAGIAGQKTEEIENVARAYRMKDVFRLEHGANGLADVSLTDLARDIRRVIEQVRPKLVYVNHPGDVHSDHRAVFRAVEIVLKSFHMKAFGVRRVVAYETLSSTDSGFAGAAPAFAPRIFNDITAHIEEKNEIMRMYETERQPEPMPRSPSAIAALARYRGSLVGVEFAEAFELLREVGP